MTKPYLRDLRADALRLQKIAGNWVVAGIETTIPWPEVAQIAHFEGIDFILRPGDDDSEPSIALNAAVYCIDRKAARDRILKLTSALAWEYGGGVEVFMWAGGGLPIRVAKWKGRIRQSFIEARSLPVVEDDGAWVALALFREGLSIKNPFYSFLSYYKVTSAIHRNGKQREKWFDQSIPKLKDERARERIDELTKLGFKVGPYLFSEGRNAIAHAEKDVFVHPDRTIDYERIYQDLPIISNLAKYAIEERYGITQGAWYSDPKIMVGPFETALGSELVKMLAASLPVGKQSIDFPDSVSLVARKGAEAKAFLNMHVDQMVQVAEGVRMVFTDAQNSVQFSIGLNTLKHELEFDPLVDMGRIVDTETVAGLDREILFLSFQACMFLNGSIEIWDEKTDKIIAKSRAYFPINMFFDYEKHQETLESLNTHKQALIQTSSISNDLKK